MGQVEDLEVLWVVWETDWENGWWPIFSAWDKNDIEDGYAIESQYRIQAIKT